MFLAGQVHRLVVDSDNLGIEIDGQLACPDRRLGVVLGSADDHLNWNCVISFELGQATARGRKNAADESAKAQLRHQISLDVKALSGQLGKGRNKAALVWGQPGQRVNTDGGDDQSGAHATGDVFTLGEVVHFAPALRPAEAALRRRQMPHTEAHCQPNHWPGVRPSHPAPIVALEQPSEK